MSVIGHVVKGSPDNWLIVRVTFRKNGRSATYR
jgi:hypothetical protein